jgi:hypothetical protein
MVHYRAPPISGSWSPGAARAVDSASLIHGHLRVYNLAETEKKVNGWTFHQGTQQFFKFVVNLKTTALGSEPGSEHANNFGFGRIRVHNRAHRVNRL